MLQQERVLIVDDDRAILTMLELVLRRHYETVTASDGAVALELLERHDVCAVVADHMMPGMSGVELLSRSLGLRPHAARILVTAAGQAEVASQAVNDAKVHRFLAKPLRVTELPAVVSGAVREVHLETENARLLAELAEKNAELEAAVAELEQHRRRLQVEVDQRTVELRLAVSQLQALAVRDGLTNLFNHRYFQSALDAELARAVRYGHEFSLLFVDVDHFKHYNDACGHPAGDRLLKRLAELLQGGGVAGGGRAADVVARYGGEEFVLVLPETGRAGALVRAERIRAAVAAYAFDSAEVQPLGHVSVSIGVAVHPHDAADKATLIARADRALYAAKRGGRDQVVSASALGPESDAVS